MKMKMNRLTMWVMLSLVLIALTACGGKENSEPSASADSTTSDKNDGIEEMKIRFAHTYPIEEPVAKGAEKFAELVLEKSDGKIEIKVFPSGQLYDDRSMPEALTSGQIEMGMNTTEMWSGHLPAAEFSALPLFSNYDEVHSALENGLDEIFTEELNKVGVEPLIWADFGFGYFASKDEPLLTPEDYKGKRIRITSPLLARYVELAGGAPITMGGLEVDQALQRGTIDAALSGLTAFAKRQYYQYTEYYTGPHNAGLILASTNLEWWNNLSDEEKAIINEAAKEAQVWISEEVEKQIVVDSETLKSEGMDYFEPDTDAFKDINEQIIEEYIKRSGEVGEKIIKVVKENK